MMKKPKRKTVETNIITFRANLLPSSETFIQNQTSSLAHYKNYYLGLRPVKNSLELPNGKVLLINDGKINGLIKEFIFKRTRIIPFKLLRQLNSISPIICHAHFGPDAIYAMWFAKYLKIPLIVTFHGYDATTLLEPTSSNNAKQKNYFKSKQALIEYASVFIAVSDFIKDKLIQQGYPVHKIIKHHIGINLDNYTPSNTKRQKTILFVGRLVEKKGCEYLIKAFTHLSSKSPDTKLIIIGDGPLRQSLEDQASKASINYEFIGNQPNSRVKEWMCKSRILCVPSIQAKNGDSEGFGMVFIEAQAVGTPVVSFKSGGIVESVSHKKTGLLAEEKDWKTLSKYLEKLLNDDSLWQKYSLAGIKRTQNKFDLKKQTHKLETIYMDILKDNPINQ